MAQWSKLLKTLGFTDSESKIYLISLEMGPSSVQDIAKKANVSRVTTYAVIESLTTHGIMSSVQKGKKTLYTAESPERLVSYMHSRIKDMEVTLREVETAINDLKLLQRGEKPVVKMFEGPEALQAIHSDILSTAGIEKDGILEVANINAIRRIFSLEDMRPFREQLDKRKIRSKGMIISNETYTPRAGNEVRLLPPKDFQFTGHLTVYGNKVAFATFEGKHIGVVIESAVISQTMRDIFKLAWTSRQFPE
jgi:HTH-type transcriptional regulator, sugar sensing transcriptional regulator